MARRGAPAHHPDTYSRVSTRPVHILYFLLPLIALYELGSILYLSDSARNVREAVSAYLVLGQVFEAFGVFSFHLPAILVVAVLVVWAGFSRDRWAVQWRVLVCMFMESAVWTLPLLVLAMMLAPTKAPAAMGLAGMDPPALADGLAAMSWQARLTLSVGAGIYEELLFRLVLITAIHFVLHDLAKLRSGTASVLAAIATAVLFAVYHRAAFGGGPISLDAANWPLLGFYTAAGLFFAALFIVRGFGIVVGTHALYDVLVLVVMPGMRDVG
jgi:hypothetical protein